MKSPQTLCLLAALACGATATAAPLFSDDFNDAAISATKWNVFNGHYVGNDGNGDPYATDDFRVEWAYDYSALTYIFYQDAGDPGTTLPVPPAPKTKDGSMKGVRLQVNKFNDQPSLDAVNLYAKDLNATGDFVVRFDLFLNHPSWIDSGVGTTEYAMFGLNFAGTNVNWTSFGAAPGFLDSPAGQNSDGFYFMTTGDGGAARNQRLALGRAGGPALDPQIVTDIYPDISAQPVFPDRDGDGTADNLLRFSDYQAFKKRLFNTPKSEFAGVAGKRWIEIELRQYQGVVTWKMDGLIVAQFTNSTPFTAGTVMLGYMDIFASITGPGQEERDQQWALYDNLTVEPIRTVTVTSANNGSPAADGQTSLLEALTDLQDNDVIKFNIPAPNTGAVAISTPQAGYPLIEKQFVTIDGYSQPGAGPNTAAPPADNNAVIKIYLDSSAGPEQRTVLDFPGFGLSESAILGVLNARGFSASGLGFLSRFTAGSDEDADIYAIALVSDSPHAHIWGNRFGFFRQGDVILPNPDLPEVYGNHALFGGRSAVANFRDAATDPGRILYASPLTIGVDGDGYGDVGEGNIAIGHGIAFHLQTPDTRLSGNRINVFPDGGFFDPALAPGYETRGTIVAMENGEGHNMLVGTDGDRVSDALEGNYYGPVRYRTYNEFWRTATNVVVAGNSFGIGPKGGLYTNAVTLVDVRSDSWIRIGSDFNGDPTVPADEAIVAADKLEANRIYNLAGPLITFHGSNNNLDGDGNPTRAARIALRGNEMVNNTGSFPISVGQNVDFPTFFAPLLADAENDHKPVLDTNSTTTTLIGRIPAYLDTPGVTEVRLEIYQADPVGRAQVSPDYPGGYLQGKEFLEYYFVDGGDDADPEPLKFRFDISALNLSEADLAGLTVVAAYYVPSPWGLPAIVRTSLFSETLGEPSTEGEPAVIAVAKDGNNLVFNVTGGTGPFQLQSRMDVATGAWSNVGDPFAGPTITIPAPATGTVFYQVTGQ